MKEILGAIAFYQAIRYQMRFGEFSRLPIRLERFEIKADSAACDWLMRPPDPWDVHLPVRQREEHLTEQALRDGLDIRELIFRGFPHIQHAELKVYRRCDAGDHELVMTGLVHRETEVLPRVASPSCVPSCMDFDSPWMAVRWRGWDRLEFTRAVSSVA